MKKGMDYIGVSADAMIFNDKGELFLAKRSQNCKNERSHWETPGGSVEFGETLIEATVREIREEYGAEIEIIEQFPSRRSFNPSREAALGRDNLFGAFQARPDTQNYGTG